MSVPTNKNWNSETNSLTNNQIKNRDFPNSEIAHLILISSCY